MSAMFSGRLPVFGPAATRSSPVSGLPFDAGNRRRIDTFVFAGWMLLLIAGQLVFPFRNEALEWFALAWLVTGMAVVRPGACLPLLIMTCPAFMCDGGSVNAWRQGLVAVVFLLRIVAACRRDRTSLIHVLFAAVLVLFLSWPGDFGAVWRGIRDRHAMEVLRDFAGAQASWYIFPIRQCLERSLAAAICAGVVRRPEFLSSTRIWRATFAAGVLALLAAFGHTLLPWQRPHLFLGTTNHARLAGLLFHGAGYNISYFSMLVALALPWFAVAAVSRTRRRFAGFAGLLWPALWIIQMAFYASVFAVSLVFCGAAARAGLRRVRAGARSLLPGLVRSAGPVFAALSALSVWYFLELVDAVGWSAVSSAAGLAVGRFIPAALIVLAAATAMLAPALIVVHLAAGFVRSLPGAAEIRFRRALLVCLVAILACSALRLSTPSGDGGRGGGAGSRSADCLTPWLERVEPARADMWAIGSRKILGEYIIRGAGAGTWARFHKYAERKTRLYYAHMHNTCLDAAFEYGVVPAAAVFVCLLLAALKIAAARDFNRLWLLYIVPCMAMALGQHLLYAFTNICLLMPVAIVTARALGRPR
jgi:hypothetical protein